MTILPLSLSCMAIEYGLLDVYFPILLHVLDHGFDHLNFHIMMCLMNWRWAVESDPLVDMAKWNVHFLFFQPSRARNEPSTFTGCI